MSNDHHIDMRVTEVLEHAKPLVTAHDMSRATVPDNGFDAAECLNAAAQFLERGMTGHEVNARVVRGGLEASDRQASEFHG
jgi:hypothetical protein